MLKRKVIFSLVLAAVLVTAACDPGISFRPNGWKEVSPNKWSNTFGDIEVETERIGGLIGSSYVGSEIRIINHSAETLIITKAVLKVHEKEYESRRLPSRGFNPGELRRLDIAFDLPTNKTISDCLNSDIADINLGLKSGDREWTLVIPYIRSL